MSRLLLIDNRVRSIEYITNSLEEGVEFFIFDYETETLDGLKSKITKAYDSIGIVQDQDNIPSYTLMKSMGDYDLNDYSTWTSYKELVEWASNLGTKIWDLIECNIDETWQPVISSLQNEFNITIRSSSKQLGNTNLGDNWVFDNGTSLIGLYFTTTINDYPHTLGSGYSLSCTYLIDLNGFVWGRGYNNYGQMGQSTPNGTFYDWTRIYIPYPSTTTQVKIVQISSTTTGAIFLTSDGDCYACGYNLNYCLGLPTLQTVYPYSGNINSYTSSNTYPSARKITISGVKYITCGYTHTLFLLNDGTVTSTGSNGSNATCYQNYTSNVMKLLSTTGLSNVYLISSMVDSTMIVFANQKNIIYFFGYNGANDTGYSKQTIILNSNINIKQIEVGHLSLYYVDENNNLYGIGYNNIGQLGQGNTTKVTTWTQILGPNNIFNKNVLKISSAVVSLLILTLTGELYYTGLASAITISTNDLQYPFSTPSSSISSKYTTSCLFLSSGVSEIFAWLSNGGSQEYTGGTGTVTLLYYIKNGVYYWIWGDAAVSAGLLMSTPSTGITSTNEIIAPQDSFSLIDITGSIWVLGTNFYGTTNVTSTNGINKVTKAFGSNVIQVTNTSRGNLVLLQNGDVWAFGYNQYGELGTTVSATTTSPVGSGAGVKLTFTGIGTNTIIFITSGLHHSFFVTSAGAVYSCGLNNYGQLGQGNITNLTTPTVISVLSNIKNCCCGLYTSYFLDNTGIVTCCGYNFNNELGNSLKVLGTSTVQLFKHYYLTPVQFNGTNKIIASGFNHSPTIISTDVIYCSGLNIYGQLGVNNTNVSYAYQILTNNPTFPQLFAGENRSASLTSSGSLFTWGKGIDTRPVLTDINVTAVYQVTDIGIIYIKNNKYYVAYASGILAAYASGPIPGIIPYNPYTNPLNVYSNI